MTRDRMLLAAMLVAASFCGGAAATLSRKTHAFGACSEASRPGRGSMTPGGCRGCSRGAPSGRYSTPAPVINRRLRAFPSWQAYSYRMWPSGARLKASYEMVQGCVNTCGSVMVAS